MTEHPLTHKIHSLARDRLKKTTQRTFLGLFCWGLSTWGRDRAEKGGGGGSRRGMGMSGEGSRGGRKEGGQESRGSIVLQF